MDPEITQAEIFRLTSPATGRRNMMARWQNIYAWYQEGRSFEDVAKHYGLSPSTITRLLKYYVARQIKNGSMQWPVDSLGRRICDIPHPMPNAYVNRMTKVETGEPERWCHVRARRASGTKTVAWCPVCKRRGKLGMPIKPKTLMEVFGSSQA